MGDNYRIDALYSPEGGVSAVVVIGGKRLHQTRWYKCGNPVDRNRWAAQAAARWAQRYIARRAALQEANAESPSHG